ncbi:MAG TPA: glycerophosphodiester phosphodiesterase family protein [Verrucomicrobiae bacterium]|nr:glycerophosphodiester phosphodiesterase family protein [Verrucomicrobiae bacterium]
MPFRLVLTCLIVFVAFVSPAAQVLAIAHRGNSVFAPENTMAAFNAANGKADMVETDGRPSSDGYLVIMHDATVDRTTDGTGAVSSLTLAQLKALDAGSWFAPAFIGERIPTLEEMLTNTIPFAIPLVEHKAGTPAAYVDEFRRLGVVTNIVLQSFDWNFLAGVHALEPALRLCALGSGTLNSNVLATITNSGARTVAWEKATVAATVVDLVHAWGLGLFVWTVDGPAIQNFIDLGVDGIISNDPGMVKQLQQTNTSSPSDLADRLVAYWKMDDGLTNAFATTVVDSKGTNPGTLTRNDGASHWFDGALGGSLKLEGTNAFVTIPPSTTLDINTNALTFSAWVRLQNLPSQLPTSYGAIFDSTTDCYVFYLDKANKELRFKVTDVNGDAARPGIPEAMLPTNQWIHLAATYSGNFGPASGQAIIYLNGQPQDVHTGNDNTSPAGLTGNVKTAQDAAMGREGPTGGNYFIGYVDDIAIWSRALSTADLQRLYQAGQTGQSLADLLRQPTSLLQIIATRKNSVSGKLEIEFKNFGPWQSFRLLRTSLLEGPFLAVPNLTPASLGEGEYRFDYPLNGNDVEYFRIEGQ